MIKKSIILFIQGMSISQLKIWRMDFARLYIVIIVTDSEFFCVNFFKNNTATTTKKSSERYGKNLNRCGES